MFLVLVSLTAASAQAASSWTPRYGGTTVNGQTVPLGYYEYLPTDYNAASPTQANYGVVIFLHGAGEWGNGLSTGSPNLSAVLGAGVPNFINNNSSPLQRTGGLLDTHNIIALCPQHNDPYPWVPQTMARPFLNFVLAAYPKIDRRRIWLTGLSYGSSGATGMLDITQDPAPDDSAAVFACAWRGDDYGLVGSINTSLIGKLVPLWVLTSQGDTSSNPDLCVNNLATAIKGSAVSDAGIFPGGAFTQPYTAYFNGTSFVLSSQQVDPISEVNPKITYFTGSDHNSWDRTYGNSNTWNWLFQQQKPDVTVTSPASDIIVAHGSNVLLSGSATDKNSTPLTGTSLQWISSIDGVLGTGATLNTTNLSYGYHWIKLQATDSGYRDNKVIVHVTVPYANAFTAYFDFGPTGAKTTGWNDVTNNKATIFPSQSFITNAVNSAGTPIGIDLGINPGFFNYGTSGVASTAAGYPLAAQEGYFQQPSTDYASNPLPNAQITVSGLNPQQLYNFTFFASTTTYEQGPTNYKINNTTVSLNPENNSSNTVSINSVLPSAAGQVVITLSRGTSAVAAWLNVLTITSPGSVPTAPVITSNPPPTATLTQSYNFSYATTGYPIPTFTVSAGGLPPGLSLSSAGVITGTPTTAGTYSGTVTATNGIAPDATQDFSIVAQNPTAPLFTNTPTATTLLGSNYSFAFTTSGNPQPTFTVSAGVLPPGLQMSSTGVITGVSTSSGSYSATVTASNGTAPNATKSFSIAVQVAPTIASAGGANVATSGTAILGYNAGGSSLSTTGTGLAHAGVTTSINDGVGSTSVDTFGNAGAYGYVGITYASPLASTISTVTLTMHVFSDGGWFGPNNVSATGATGGATGGNLVAAALTDPQVQITTDGVTWTNVASTDNYISKLTGVAANNVVAPMVTFTLTNPVSNIRGLRIIGTNGGTAGTSAHGFIGVNQMQLLTQPIPSGTTGVAYNFAFSSTGYPVPTFTVSVGNLPPGLSLSSSGVISGTPTTVGTFTGTVAASNGIGSPATQNFSIPIVQGAGTSPTISGTAPGGAQGTAYSFSYTVGGSPVPTETVTAGSLPPGLSISSTGTISGTPMTVGTYSGTITATNTAGSTPQNFSIVIISAYAQWANSYYGANSPNGAPGAMPQGDGVSNLIKYLCGFAPNVPVPEPGRSLLPTVSTTNNGQFLTITYRQSPAALGLTIQAQSSSDLVNWSPLTSTTVGTDSGTGYPIMQAQVSTVGVSKEYLRVNVTTP